MTAHSEEKLADSLPRPEKVRKRLFLMKDVEREGGDLERGEREGAAALSLK